MGTQAADMLGHMQDEWADVPETLWFWRSGFQRALDFLKPQQVSDALSAPGFCENSLGSLGCMASSPLFNKEVSDLCDQKHSVDTTEGQDSPNLLKNKRVELSTK